MRKYTHQGFGLTPNFHSLIVLLMALWAKMLSSRSKLSKYSNSAVYRQSHVRPHQSVLSRQCFKVENRGVFWSVHTLTTTSVNKSFSLLVGSIVILFCMLRVVLIQWKGSQEMNLSLKRFCHIPQLCGLLLLLPLRYLKCMSQGISTHLF